MRASEWVLAGSFGLILLSLFTIAKMQAWRYAKGPERAPVAYVTVKIDGCVQRPGVYEFALGTPRKEILHKARPMRFADLRTVDLEEVLTGPLELTIPALEKLKISVTGAVVQSETIEVAAGTRLCQLKQKIALADGADLAFFKKRRLLADGELVVVPCVNKE